MLKPKFIEIDGFKIIGYKLRTTIKDEKSYSAIPKFWDDFFEKGLLKNFPKESLDNPLLGLEYDFRDDCFDYYICRKVPKEILTPVGMDMLEVPAARYAVFTAKGKDIVKAIQQVDRAIYGEWLPSSSYKFAGTPCFEEYGPKSCECNDEPEVDIYVPIIKESEQNR